MPGATPVNYDPQYEEWVKQGKPGDSFEAWKATQPAAASTTPAAPSLYNPDGTAKNGSAQPTRNADGSISPQTFEQRMAAGEFAGNEAKSTELEVQRRRRLIADNVNGSGGPNGGFDVLPPDIADMVLKDPSGRVRKARGGSTRSALGQAFRPTAPIGSSSILGDY